MTSSASTNGTQAPATTPVTSTATRLGLARLSRFVPVLLGVTLVCTAALKVHASATEPVPETDVMSARWFQAVLVQFELAFGLWLVSGLSWRWANGLGL